MNESKSRDRLVGGTSQIDRVELLLDRYPATSDAEAHEIADFLKHASPLEVGLLSSNASVWTKVEQYKVDHPQHFRTSWIGLLVWLGLAAGVVLAVILLWDVGAI